MLLGMLKRRESSVLELLPFTVYRLPFTFIYLSIAPANSATSPNVPEIEATMRWR